MTYRISICDDDPVFLAKIQTMVEDFFKGRPDQILIHAFSDPSLFLAFREPSHLYLLDIRMPEIMGTELAGLLRRSPEHSDSSIIFISSMHDAVYDAFRYSPLRFIRKELLNEELGEALCAFLYHMQAMNKGTELLLHEGNQISRIHTDNILYIETCRHYLDFHCLDRKLHVRGQISEYEEVLRSCSFARAHQGYLVNLCHVSFISKKSVTLKNGSEISFSRSYRDTFIEAYMNLERSQKHVLTV